MSSVPQLLLLISAVALNAWLMRSRLDSFICAAIWALPLLRLQATLDAQDQLKVTKSTRMFGVPHTRQHVVRLVIPITLVCVMVHITSFGTSPFLTVFGAIIAALQVCRTYDHVKSTLYRTAHLMLDRCPNHLRRIIVAGSLLSVVLGLGVLGSLLIGFSLYKEFQIIRPYVGNPTWAEGLQEVVIFNHSFSNQEESISKLFKSSGIDSILVQDYLKAILSILSNSSPIYSEQQDIINRTKLFINDLAEPVLRIVLQSTPILYYILAAEENPWIIFHKICSKMGAQLFCETLMVTLESILVCCCKRLAIYGMLGFCVAVFAGLQCPMMFAVLSASQGLMPLHPPETLYVLIAVWIGFVQGRIFMMLILLAIAGTSAWLTLLTVHGQIPFQNRFYMGLCVIIGLMKFGPLGMILGPLIGSLPVLFSMTIIIGTSEKSTLSTTPPHVDQLIQLDQTRTNNKFPGKIRKCD